MGKGEVFIEFFAKSRTATLGVYTATENKNGEENEDGDLKFHFFATNGYLGFEVSLPRVPFRLPTGVGAGAIAPCLRGSEFSGLSL
jgi:hypothetical protein